MDKTYSDLMDIVNRTKKFDTGVKTVRRPRPRAVVEDNDVEEEYVPKEYDIEEKEARAKKGSNLLGGALGKLLGEDKPKKSATKKSTSKSTTKSSSKSATKKSTTKKAPAKKSTTKSTTKKETTKKVATKPAVSAEPKPKKLTPKDSLLNDMDISDPKNAQLYEALKSSLYSGGTDISEYIPESESNEAQESLQELRAKREANKINAEITKEQQEYEKLFTGSLGLFGAEEEIPANQPESYTNTQSKVELDSSSDATYELDTGNKDLDKKIAEYYRRKQEKIDEYKKLEENGFEDSQKARDVYEDRKQAYQDMFGGPLMSRQEEKEEKTEENLPSQIETVAHSSQIAKVETEGKEWAEDEKQEEIDRDDHIRSLLSGLLSSRAEKEEMRNSIEEQQSATQLDTSNSVESQNVESNVESESNEIATNDIDAAAYATEDNQVEEVVENNIVDEISNTNENITDNVSNSTEENVDINVVLNEGDTTSDNMVSEVVEDNALSITTTNTSVGENTTSVEESVEDVSAENNVHEVSEEKRDELINSVIMGALANEDNNQTESIENVNQAEVAEVLSTDSSTTNAEQLMEDVTSNQVGLVEGNVVDTNNIVNNNEVVAESSQYNNEQYTQPLTSENMQYNSEVVTENTPVVEGVVDDENNNVNVVEDVQSNIQENIITNDADNGYVSEDQDNNDMMVANNLEENIESVETSEASQEETLEDIIDEEDDYANLDDEELDRIDRSINPEDFTEYIVSSNVLNERSEKITKTLDEYEDIVRNERMYEKNFGVEKDDETPIVNNRESKTYMMGDVADTNNHVDYFDNEEIDYSNVEETKVEEEKEDTISKEEFYNEMARLQENLINELKGNKVTEGTQDYFAEKEKALNDTYEQPKSAEDQKAEKIVGEIVAEYMEDMEEMENMKEEKMEEVVNTAEVAKVDVNNEPTSVDNTVVNDNVMEETTKVVEQNVVEEVAEKPSVDYTPAEVSQPVMVGEDRFDEFNLLNTEVALNEDDLNYEQEKEESENKEFYLSAEDNEKKALTDDYIDMFSNVKDMGDININKDIANAIPSSEVLKQQQEELVENSTPAEVDDDNELSEERQRKVEEIFTIMGIHTKPAKEDNKELKVLYVASECQPFIATGGLADVAGSLPKAIAEEGNIDIRVIMPLYGKIKEKFGDKLEYLGNFTVHLSWRQEYCGLFRYRSEGVTYYFVDNERYFKRDKIYGYYDDGERYAYFSKAVVEGLPMINFFPDIIHCNDWQSALVSTYIKTGNWSDFRYYKIKHIYTIHNVEYQGVYGMENLKDLFGIDPRFRNDMEYNGDINLTKAAIQFSDKFTTVSDSYCDNLKQPYCSRGLHHIIIRNEYKLSGIINGIDYNFYSPATDKCLYKNFDLASMDEKVLNKKIWQEELGLPVDGDTPMISIVSRLVGHKGMDLVNKVMENTLQQNDIQLVVVGTGDQRFVDYFKYLESKYPTKVRALVDAYSNELARKAYGASDIFLMPSKVEPCGISQMIASRYGAVPIVREVGGLKDSIKDFGCEGGGNGYTFTNYNPNDLQYTLDRAIKDYQNKPEWKEKMRICMTTDFTWKEPAKKYIALYNSLKY